VEIGVYILISISWVDLHYFWFTVCVVLCILRAALDDIPYAFEAVSQHSLLDVLDDSLLS
jgi:hypothetical protein